MVRNKFRIAFIALGALTIFLLSYREAHAGPERLP
jgi:hypothetical protein